MHSMTKENLKSILSGESKAHMKYLMFADMICPREMPYLWYPWRAV